MKARIKRLCKRAKVRLFDVGLLRGYRFKMPKDLIIETTNICSLACSCCPNGDKTATLRSHGRMDRDTFHKVLDHIDIPIKNCYLHMCGEPFLCKDLPYFVDVLANKGITPIVFSNGYHIDKDILRQVLKHSKLKISFSADLLSKEHYERLRYPAKYETMLAQLDEIDTIFTECKRFYFLNVIVDTNRLDSIADICRSLFERYKRLLGISLNSQWPWPKLHQLGDLPGHLLQSPRICNQAKSAMPVLWNGDVAFCASDYCGDTVVGNVLDQPYSHIFNNGKARKIRRNLLRLRQDKASPLCSNCVYPSYESMTLMLLRGKFLKSSAKECQQIMSPLAQYYNLWKDQSEKI